MKCVFNKFYLSNLLALKIYKRLNDQLLIESPFIIFAIQSGITLNEVDYVKPVFLSKIWYQYNTDKTPANILVKCFCMVSFPS